MPSVLPEIIAHKRVEVAERKAAVSQALLEREIEPGDGSFLRALQGTGLKLVTEIKPSSPSSGVLRAQVDIDTVLDSYNRYASGISVLTDKKYFNGSMELLSEVVRKSPHPVLCKDFILDSYQVYEARKSGAQAMLLIVKILEDNQLAQLHETIRNVGMTPVIEVQSEEEVERALKLSPEILVINNRDLMTFDIDLETTKRLVPKIPAHVITISASGVQDRSDIESLLPFCSRFLIGSALMKSHYLEAKLKELIST